MAATEGFTNAVLGARHPANEFGEHLSVAYWIVIEMAERDDYHLRQALKYYDRLAEHMAVIRAELDRREGKVSVADPQHPNNIEAALAARALESQP